MLVSTQANTGSETLQHTPHNGPPVQALSLFFALFFFIYFHTSLPLKQFSTRYRVLLDTAVISKSTVKSEREKEIHRKMFTTALVTTIRTTVVPY